MNEQTALAKLDEALGLVDEFVEDRALLPQALLEGLAYDHATYDMFYLVLAKQRKGTLFTFDKKLIGLCDQVGVDCVHFFDKGGAEEATDGEDKAPREGE